MRTSLIFTAALFSIFTASTATAETNETGETVVFELNLNAPSSELYAEISQQAWEACAADRKANSVFSRTNTTRKCQRRLIANVVEALDTPAVTTVAKADGIALKDS